MNNADAIQRARNVANMVFTVGARYVGEANLIDLAVGFVALDKEKNG